MFQEMLAAGSGGGGANDYAYDVYPERSSASDRYNVTFKPTHDHWVYCYQNYNNSYTIIQYWDSSMGTNFMDCENGTATTKAISSEFTVNADGSLTRDMNGRCRTMVTY